MVYSIKTTVMQFWCTECFSYFYIAHCRNMYYSIFFSFVALYVPILVSGFTCNCYIFILVM